MSAYEALWNLGKQEWNRWARTIVTEEAIDALPISENRKRELKSITPLSEVEQKDLAGRIGLVSLEQLENSITNIHSIGQLDFSGYIFPLRLDLSSTEIVGPINFNDTIFLDDVSFQGRQFKHPIGFKRAVFQGYTDFRDARFHRTAGFEDTIFLGSVDFSDVRFTGSVSFSNSSAKKLSNFENVHFHSRTKFDGVSFFGGVDFNGSTFNGRASFLSTKFKAGAFFENVDFKNATNFNKTQFSEAPKFHNASLHQDTVLTDAYFYTPALEDTLQAQSAASAWRVLKLAMNKNHNHSQEIMFFMLEMDAKREAFWKTKGVMPKLNWFGYSLYKWVSGYGNSVTKPFLAGLLSYIAFVLLYRFNYWSSPPSPMCWNESLKLSFASLLPFTSSSKIALMNVLDANKEIPWDLQMATSSENIIGAVLIFLIGLALRNKFTIK